MKTDSGIRGKVQLWERHVRHLDCDGGSEDGERRTAWVDIEEGDWTEPCDSLPGWVGKRPSVRSDPGFYFEE